MGDKPIWEQIGSSFVQHYYQLFDADRTQLGAIYIDASCLTWEGQQFQGKAAIVEKLTSLPFQKIQHSITAQDHQPTPDSCILSMVVGQLKLFLDSGSGNYYVAGQVYLLLEDFQIPDHYLDHPGNVVDTNFYRNSLLSSTQSAADEDPIMGFHQIFLLKNINDAWVCTNDMFRLALHNFG